MFQAETLIGWRSTPDTQIALEYLRSGLYIDLPL